MRHIPLSRIAAAAHVREPGYQKAVLAAGTIHGNTLRLTEEAYRALVARFGERAPVPTPSAAELLSDFTRATARWVAQGFPVVNQHTYAQRLATCRACRLPDNTPTWDESARFGLGRCARCRCTNLKLWAATTHCPIGRW